MSGFAEWALRSTFDRNPQVALALNGSEIKGPGYSRFTPGAWDKGDQSAGCVARFGVFAVPMRFDEAWVVLGGEVIDRSDLGESLFPAGSSFELQVVIELEEQADG